jgi:hypothetical protein
VSDTFASPSLNFDFLNKEVRFARIFGNVRHTVVPVNESGAGRWLARLQIFFSF